MPLLTLLGILVLALIPRLAFIYYKGLEFFNGDFGLTGLMAKHITEGKWMIYNYGLAYMGSFEATVAALFFKLGGVHVHTLYLAPLASFLAFLTVNFFLTRKLFGTGVSIISSLLLAIGPFGLTEASLAALGGYPETLFFGTLVCLLGLLTYEAPRKKKPVFLFWTGFAAGMGLWVHQLILMFLIPLAIFGFLRSDYWAKKHSSFRLSKFFFLRYPGLPPWLRRIALVIHSGVLMYAVWQIISFLTGPENWQIGPLHLRASSPPFLVKVLKRALLILLIESGAVIFFSKAYKRIGARLKSWLPLGAGLALGNFPALLHKLIDGEGMRMIHASGMVFAKDLPRHFNEVMIDSVMKDYLGVFPESRTGYAVLFLSGLLLGVYVFQHGKEIKKLIRFKPFLYSYSFFPGLLAAVVLTICLLNQLTANRYLTPLYFALPLILALALDRVREKFGRAAAASITLVFLLIYGYQNAEVIATPYGFVQSPDPYREVLDYLKRQNLKAGYAEHQISFAITFRTREEIRMAPYRAYNHYPAYKEFADTLLRVAYVFHQSDEFANVFQAALDQNDIHYKKDLAGRFWVFILDRAHKSEKGLIPE